MVKLMVLHDTIAVTLVVLSGCIALYFATYEKGFISMFPALLLVLGLILQLLFSRGFNLDEQLDITEAKTILQYTLLCMGVVAIAGIVSDYMPIYPIPSLATTQALTQSDVLMYSQLMAVAEEQFFRGALTLFFLKYTRNWTVTSICGGISFMIYHFAVYGSIGSALWYVMFNGVAFTFATVRTMRLSPAMIAHCLANFIAVVGTGGI